MKDPPRSFYLIVAIIFVVVASVVGVVNIGIPPMMVIGTSGILALIAWLNTTYKAPANPETVVPIFLLTVAALIVHMLEEYLTGFGPSMSRTFDIDFTERTFLIVFAFVGPAIYAVTAIGLLYRHPLANYMAWFIFIGPGFMEFAHFLFPIFEGGPYHYFSGMGTAVLPMIPGIYGMYRLYDESRTGTSGAA